MALVCIEYMYYSCRKGPTKIPLGKGTPHGNMKLFHAKMKVNTCTVCEIGSFTDEEEEEEDDEKLGFWCATCRSFQLSLGNFTSAIVAVYFSYFESFIVYSGTSHNGPSESGSKYRLSTSPPTEAHVECMPGMVPQLAAWPISGDDTMTR